METQLENYIPELSYNGMIKWLPKKNYSVTFDGEKLYGLPEDSEKYFIKHESYGYKKPRY